jgi:hypothetical protein
MPGAMPCSAASCEQKATTFLPRGAVADNTKG